MTETDSNTPRSGRHDLVLWVPSYTVTGDTAEFQLEQVRPRYSDHWKSAQHAYSPPSPAPARCYRTQVHKPEQPKSPMTPDLILFTVTLIRPTNSKQSIPSARVMTGS